MKKIILFLFFIFSFSSFSGIYANEEILEFYSKDDLTISFSMKKLKYYSGNTFTGKHYFYIFGELIPLLANFNNGFYQYRSEEEYKETPESELAKSKGQTFGSGISVILDVTDKNRKLKETVLGDILVYLDGQKIKYTLDLKKDYSAIKINNLNIVLAENFITYKNTPILFLNVYLIYEDKENIKNKKHPIYLQNI